MGKWYLRILGIIIFSLIIPYLPISDKDNFFSVLFTVLGIMLPVGLSQIMSFSFSNIQNEQFIKRYREQLTFIRRVFIILFSIATIFFLLDGFCFKVEWKLIKLDVQNVFLSYFLFCFFYYVVNFIALAKLKDEIEDEVRKHNTQ